MLYSLFLLSQPPHSWITLKDFPVRFSGREAYALDVKVGRRKDESQSECDLPQGANATLAWRSLSSAPGGCIGTLKEKKAKLFSNKQMLR